MSEANVTPTVNQKFELRIPKRRSRKRFRVADEVRNRKKLDGIAVKLEDKATGGSDYKTSRAAAQIGNGASPALNKNRRDSG